MDIYDLTLTLTKAIGIKTAIHLIECFGSAEKIFSATKEELEGKAKLNSEAVNAILKRHAFASAEKEIKFASKNEIAIIAATDDDYPKLLKECNDYPHVIYTKGSIDALNKRSLSIVGTRKNTEYGRKVCDRIVEELSRITSDITIVSGLAKGIDGYAHRAAIANGMPTVAVLPTPMNIITPADHTILAREILNQGGCLITEYHSNAVTKNYGFVARNRIIAGLSEGTLIVESPKNGGSLITAGLADGYGRSVMAIPGRLFDTSSQGTNHIIKTQQARLICSAWDIVNELAWGDATSSTKKIEPQTLLSIAAIRILEYIKEGDTISIDMLSHLSGESISSLASIILELEFEGYIKRLPGNAYERE